MMVVLPLSILALAAGVYLLIKVQREYLGGTFNVLAWLVIILSLVSIGFTGFRAFSHKGCHGGGGNCHTQTQGHCNQNSTGCTMNGGPHTGCTKTCDMKGSGTCPMMMEGMKAEGDSIVCDPATCKMLMGEEGCAKMCKERGRCVMSKEECAKACKDKGCHAATGTK